MFLLTLCSRCSVFSWPMWVRLLHESPTRKARLTWLRRGFVSPLTLDLKIGSGSKRTPKLWIRRLGVAACQRLTRSKTLRDALSAMLTRARRRSVEPPVMTFAGGGSGLVSWLVLALGPRGEPRGRPGSESRISADDEATGKRGAVPALRRACRQTSASSVREQRRPTFFMDDTPVRAAFAFAKA